MFTGRGSAGPWLGYKGASVDGREFGLVDADRRGEDSERIRGRLAGPGGRSIRGLETDSSGNYHLEQLGVVSGSSPALGWLFG